MKRHGYLFEQVTAFANLLRAARQAQRGKLDRLSVTHFAFHRETELLTLQEELLSGSYRMRPYRTFVIHKPKRRQICAADFRDRVVHHAICHVLDPLFEACLIHDTYACRRGKGSHAAVKRAQDFARRFPYYLKCDVLKYFASIDHAVLTSLLRRKLKDHRLLALLDHIIVHPIPGGVLGKGVPIGNLTSQYFANLYLGALDHLLKDRLRIRGYVRYMDDFLVFADNKPSLHATLATVRTFLRQVLLLELKDEVMRLAPVTQGIPFLGFRIFPGLVRLEAKKWARFRQRIRELEAQYRCGMMDEQTLARSVTSMIGHGFRLLSTRLCQRRASTDSPRVHQVMSRPSSCAGAGRPNSPVPRRLVGPAGAKTAAGRLAGSKPSMGMRLTTHGGIDCLVLLSRRH